MGYVSDPMDATPNTTYAVSWCHFRLSDILKQQLVPKSRPFARNSRLYLLSVVSFLSAVAITLVMVPIVRRTAWRWNFVDRPDRNRKHQVQPVALGGGLALLVGVVGAMIACPWWAANFECHNMVPGSIPMVSMFIGMSLIFVAGSIDDSSGMRARHKLIMQVAAALIVLVGCHSHASNIEFAGQQISIGILGFPLCLLVIVGSINAFNLIDGVDGLAGTIGIVIALAIAVAANLQGNLVDVLFLLSVAGSLLAFLVFNRRPATIYLGDTGSMLVGLILGSAALRSCHHIESDSITLTPLFAIWSLLVFDVVAAMIRRKLTDRSVYACDRAHIHHRLLAMGLTTNQVVFSMAGLCIATSVAGLLSMWLNDSRIAMVSVSLIGATLIGLRIFGHVESILVARKFSHVIQAWMNPHANTPQTTAIQVQGTADWDAVWKSVVQTAEQSSLSAVRLSLSVANRNEAYYASWTNAHIMQDDSQWEIERPIIRDGIVIGSLTGSGNPQDATCESQRAFLRLADSLAPQIYRIIDEAHQTPTPNSRPVVKSHFAGVQNNVGALTP